MLSNSLLNKIKSKFIIEKIFEYATKKKELYKLKIFEHCKSIQKKFEIELIDYQYYYLTKEYDIYYYNELKFEQINFDKNQLFKEAENDLKESGLTVNEAKSIILQYKEKNKIKLINEEKILILKEDIKKYDIYCPFIDIILPEKQQILINLPLNYIEKYDLKNDYQNFFQKNKDANLLNISFNDIKQMKLLDNLGIDFSLIKSIFLDIKKINKNNDSDESEEKIKIFSDFFSLKNLNNNLETLYLNLYEISYSYTITNDQFELLNDFNSLKHIYFSHLNLSSPFFIKLPTLETINFSYCENIYFLNDNTTKNIKYIYITNLNKNIAGSTLNNNIIYKFPNLEELYIYSSNINIDFQSLTKLKKLGFEDISLLENICKYSPLENIIPLKAISDEFEKKLIKIVFSKKTLKTARFLFKHISNKDIANISTINDNIKYLQIFMDKYEFDLNNFIQKFSDIKELNISSDICDESQSITLENNDNVIIETLNIQFTFMKEISFSFDKIKNLYLYIDLIEKNTFPLFNDECPYIFNSLKQLLISNLNFATEMEVFSNLCKNINNCINLEKLSIELIIPEFEVNVYQKFIENIVLKRIKFFSITIIYDEYNELEYYSVNELKEKFPNKIYEYTNYYRIQKIENIDE